MKSPKFYSYDTVTGMSRTPEKYLNPAFILNVVAIVPTVRFVVANPSAFVTIRFESKTPPKLSKYIVTPSRFIGLPDWSTN